MNKRNTLFLITAIITYIIVQFWRWSNTPIPTLVNSYLTDIICMPIVLGLSTIIVSIIKRGQTIFIRFSTVTLLTLLYALIFEGILPHQSAKYTADFYDVIMYILGAYTYFFCQTNQFSIKAGRSTILA